MAWYGRTGGRFWLHSSNQCPAREPKDHKRAGKQGEGKTVHFVILMDLRHFKNEEVTKQFQKNKRRVVLVTWECRER